MGIKNRLETYLSMLFVSTLILGIIIFWISIESNDFQPMPWLTLIIGSSFGLAITVIASMKSQQTLNLIEEAEDEKKSHAKLLLKKNFEKLNKLVKNYYDTIKDTDSTTDKQIAIKTIIPSLNTFLNICEITLPNIGNLITIHELEHIDEKFSILHRLFLILESGNEEQFEKNIPNLKKYTKNLMGFLEKI